MKKGPLTPTEYLGLKSFMNSFIRDFHEDDRLQITDRVLIKTDQGEICLPFKKKSLVGLHEYGEEIFLNAETIGLSKLASCISSSFAKGDNTEFLNYLTNSQENLSQILEANKDYCISNYLDSEKKLLLGHPFHPYPKCKSGMSPSEIQKYSPEFDGEFSLTWLEVVEDAYSGSLTVDEYREAVKELVDFDLDITSHNLLVPMHPWQWDRLRNSGLIDPTMIRKVATGNNTFHALSSVRSLFNEKSPLLVKFSMDLRLTNSIRHLQPEEAIRGKQVESVLRSEGVADSTDNFEVLYEPFFVCLLGRAGEALKEGTIQFRENFSSNVNLDETYLLSSLCEKNPNTHNYKINELIESLSEGNLRLARKNWFNAFLNNSIKPFFKLASIDGVLLGAHMQNILVTLENGVPSGSIYRDCQGTGFTEKGFDLYSEKYYFIKKENGNILEKDDVNKVFGYYLVVNTIFSTIGAISESSSEVEYELLNDFRTFLYKLKSEFEETYFLDYLIESGEIWQKGNMRCCLNSINENTTANPWDIYNKIENPLSNLRPVTMGRSGELYTANNKKGVEIKLRTLEESDLDVFHEWHNKEFVSEFWELNVSKEEILKYIQALKASPYQLPIMMELDGVPAGYFEAYWAYDDRIAPYCEPDIYDRGVHLLFGEEKYLRTRVVFDALFHISKFLLEDNEKTQRVWGEPRADNSKVLKLADRLPGWRFIREFDFPHKRSALIVCEKETFYKEIDDVL